MDFTIKGLTDSSLCNHCRESLITITSTGSKTVRCHASYNCPIVPPNIVKCNKFLSVGQPTEYEMNQQAWSLNTKNGKPVGFSPPIKKIEDET